MALNLYKNETITAPSGVYILQKFLGNGAFGEVFKGIKQETSEAVALKFITKNQELSATREASLLKHLSELQADQNNLIKLIDHFEYNDSFCLVFEMLDMDLFDLLEMRQEKPLDVSEVRVVARDLLVALRALKNAGLTHTDIKPDNIMLVNHQSQPFRVKLIDFGLATETHDLQFYDEIQVCGFRAPEVNLGLPLSEAVDMWAVACTLAFLFLGDFIHVPSCEYNNMRQIFKLHGLPDQDLLHKGTKVDRFFIFDQSNQTWTFKDPQEYTETGNQIMINSKHLHNVLDSLDDFFETRPEIQDPFELEDLQAFIDLLKKMFTVNPSERITPEEALNHTFITMSHLPPTSNNSYVISAYEKMNVYKMEEEETTGPSPDFIVGQTADRKSDLFNFNLSDYDLSDSDLSELDDSDSGLFDSGLSDFNLSDSDLSDLDTDQESNESGNRSDFQLDKIQEANFSDINLNDSELEASRRDKLDETSFELYKDQTITGESGVYVIQKFLGRGAFGQVIKALKQGTDEVVALKFIHKDKSKSATREASILKHLRELQADQNNLIKLIDHFAYNDSFCLVFEMLDMDLIGLFEMREREPLDVSEVRVVARDLLVALRALKNAGLTHTDIKPDNIMLVNHQSQPFRVKLIDFGLAMETHNLQFYDEIQVCGFRAPEVNLGLPLSEAVDMWAVACTLALLFLGDFIHVPPCEYNNMRQIFKLHGLPDQDLLHKGTKVDRFFIFDQSNQTWRFKTPQEYTETGNQITIRREHLKYKLDSLDDFFEIRLEMQDPFELEDLQAFIDLLKKMFTVNPSERITPEEALNHRFITMSHLPPTSNNSYVISAYEKMNVYKMEEEETTGPSPDFIVGQTADRKSDLFNFNLSDYDLSDSDLSELDDSYSGLFDSCLSDFNLSDSDLSDSDLSELDDSDSGLFDSCLSDFNLSDSDLSDSDLSELDDSDSGLFDSCLSDFNLSDSDLSDSDLSELDDSDSGLFDSCLSDFNLSDSDLSDSDLSELDDSDSGLFDSCLSDFNLSDSDLSDSDLSELDDSDSGLFDSCLSDFNLTDSDLSDLDTDQESNESGNRSDFQLNKIQEANFSDINLNDSELEASRRDKLDETSFELYKDQTITGESGVYIIQKFLGRGAFGQVVKALKQGTDEVVALKFIHKDKSKSATREASILKHLRELQADQNNLIKLIDHFKYNDNFCLVFEMLDMDLIGLFEMREREPLDVSEVRVVARDLLVALRALKNAGLTHTDIKPDNIMLVNHQSQPFRVKLIDFGLAMETHNLQFYDEIQVCGFRAPEVNLGLPLSEAVDMWAVACTLALLFLGDFIHVPPCEYNNMRQIFKLHGLPDQDLLHKGTKVDRFFIFDQSNQTWRFKTPQEYTETGNQITIRREHLKYKLDSLDDFFEIRLEMQDPFELEDLQAFIDLLKKMFTVNPSERITPEEALNHRFITMSHLPPTSNNSYVISAYEKMNVYKMEEEETTGPSPDFIVGQTADRKSDLFNFNLSDYDLSDSDLSELDDSYSGLFDSCLSDFNLSDSDLSDSDLSELDDSDSGLFDSCLSDFNLSDSDLSDSDLSELDDSDSGLFDSCLSDFNLSDSDLSDSDLSELDDSDSGLFDSCLSDFNLSDSDLSDSDLSELDDSDSGLFDSCLSDFNLTDSDLSDLDTDQESNESGNRSDFQLNKIQEANFSDINLNDSELEASRRDKLDETSFELYKDQTITGESGVYIIQKFLGRGAFGQVVKALKQGTDEVVALKFIHKDKSKSATREASILKHLRELQADQNNLIKLIDHFKYNDNFCLVFEMLDMDLIGLFEMREREPLDVSEVRVVARDLLVALRALKNAGLTHTDIKPDNIMLVNHQSQPFRVKLIDFGLAMETHNLQFYDEIQVCGFRAPEVNLGLPLSEAVDMWAVACTLALLFLGDFIHVPPCEYNNMRQIFKLHGLPDQDLLHKGTKVDRFFIFDQSNQTWRFKTPQEYTETGNQITIRREHLKYKLDSLDDFFEIRLEIQDPFELEDLQAFIDLLKKMFTVNPSERITPEEALNHTFITMSHLPPTSNNSYVISAYEKMNVYKMEEEETTDPSPDFIVGQTADRKSDLFDFNLSDYDLSDSDLSELDDSDSGLSDLNLSDSDLSDSDLSELEDSDL